jgi:hypothetical protein
MNEGLRRLQAMVSSSPQLSPAPNRSRTRRKEQIALCLCAALAGQRLKLHVALGEGADNRHRTGVGELNEASADRSVTNSRCRDILARDLDAERAQRLQAPYFRSQATRCAGFQRIHDGDFLDAGLTFPLAHGERSVGGKAEVAGALSWLARDLLSQPGHGAGICAGTRQAAGTY